MNAVTLLNSPVPPLPVDVVQVFVEASPEALQALMDADRAWALREAYIFPIYRKASQ